MKKAFLFLSAALLAMVACNKSETVKIEDPSKPGEMTFKALSSVPTKAGELTGISLPKTYGIYAAATQKNASGLIENRSFFADPFEQLFGTTEDDPAGIGTASAASDGRKWHAGTYNSGTSTFSATPMYWPIGGVVMDFLAYSLPMADHVDCIGGPHVTPLPMNSSAKWAVCWDNQRSDVASKFTFYDVDTYVNQVDLMYAAANGQTSKANGGGSGANSVAMEFNHAQALLIFNVRVDEEEVGGKLQIDEIGFYTPDRVDAMLEHQLQLASGNSSHVLADLTDADVTLKTFGTFCVDNSRNDLLASWSFGKDRADAAVSATRKENFKMKSIGAGAVSAANTTVLAQAAPNNALKIDYGQPIPFVDATGSQFHQLGETLLVPQQEKVNFTITYTIGGKTMFYTYNDFRGVWEKGKKYIYNLDLDINEIVITEEVNDFVAAPNVVNL